MTDPDNIDEAYEQALLAYELDMAREDVKLAAEARARAVAAYHRAVDRFIQADHAYEQAHNNRPVQNMDDVKDIWVKDQTGVTCVACQRDPCKCHEYKRDAGMGGLRYGDDPGRSGPTA